MFVALPPLDTAQKGMDRQSWTSPAVGAYSELRDGHAGPSPHPGMHRIGPSLRTNVTVAKIVLDSGSVRRAHGRPHVAAGVEPGAALTKRQRRHAAERMDDCLGRPPGRP